jgi:hypothetical protein
MIRSSFLQLTKLSDPPFHVRAETHPVGERLCKVKVKLFSSLINHFSINTYWKVEVYIHHS